MPDAGRGSSNNDSRPALSAPSTGRNLFGMATSRLTTPTGHGELAHPGRGDKGPDRALPSPFPHFSVQVILRIGLWLTVPFSRVTFRTMHLSSTRHLRCRPGPPIRVTRDAVPSIHREFAPLRGGRINRGSRGGVWKSGPAGSIGRTSRVWQAERCSNVPSPWCA